jgi:hypothetical protein
MPSARQRRTIPYDYAFRFTLAGAPERSQSATVEVSVEAAFVAASIGYGVVPKVEPLRFGGTAADLAPPQVGITTALPLAPSSRVFLNDIRLGAILRLGAKATGEDQLFPEGETGPQTAALLESGLRFNPEVLRQILLVRGGAIDVSFLDKLFEFVAPPAEEIQFLYALFDEGTGRAFQSEPLLSTAGLGNARGDRPFRQFAVPILFEPRTVIRMEVTELSTFKGALFVSLHGYKVLGSTGTPTGPAVTAVASATQPQRQARRRR